MSVCSAGEKALRLWTLFSVCAVLSLDCCFNPSSPPLMRQLGPCHCVFMLERPPLASQAALQSFMCRVCSHGEPASKGNVTVPVEKPINGSDGMDHSCI